MLRLRFKSRSGDLVHYPRGLPNKRPRQPLHWGKINTMELTDAQTAEKKAVAQQLLTIKQNSYKNLLAMQEADMGEAREVNENEENLFEDGKVDQAYNRVEARARVVEGLQRDIDLLSNLDNIEPTEEIQMGDIIETDQGLFFVGAASDAFEVEGKTYRGISTDSPLYLALRGKHDGDTVKVNDNKFKLITSY